jgi:glucokinase
MLIGVDIGGSSIKVGAVASRDFRVLARMDLPFEKHRSFEDFLAALVDTCRELERRVGEAARAIGLCAPGFGDQVSGALRDGGANVPALRGRPLASLVSERLGIPAHFENDGVAAALGETRLGAGRTFKRALVLTLGTGVGGCVVIEGNPMKGARGEPPEIGAMILDDGGPAHGSGRAGSLESYASTAGFLAAYRKAGGAAQVADARELFSLAVSDAAAAGAVDATARRIARAIGTLTNALALDGCVIGGGIGQAGDGLVAPVRKHLPDFTWPLLLEALAVVPAAHGNAAGLIGAASLAAEKRD